MSRKSFFGVQIGGCPCVLGCFLVVCDNVDGTQVGRRGDVGVNIPVSRSASRA